MKIHENSIKKGVESEIYDGHPKPGENNNGK